MVTPHRVAATSPKGDFWYRPVRLVRAPPPSWAGATARVRAIGTEASEIIIATMQNGMKPAGSVAGRRGCPAIPPTSPVMA